MYYGYVPRRSSMDGMAWHVLPNGVGLYCAWNTDNGGPMAVGDILGNLAGLAGRYPNADVKVSTFDAFYDAAWPVLGELPVITQEIGDTWNYGVPSDPLKNVYFRFCSVSLQCAGST